MDNNSENLITEEKSLRDRTIETAKHGDAADLLVLWDDIIANPPDDQDFYNQLIRARATTYDSGAVLELLKKLTDALVEREEWQTILRLVDSAVTIWPEEKVFRDAVSLAIQAKYADYENLSEMLEMTKLESGAPIDQALKRFRTLLRFSKGRAYQHATWGVGTVQSVDLKNGKVTLDFPEEKGRVLTFAGVRDFLTYLPPTHYLALRATEPETLMEIAEQDPVKIIRMILDSNKGKIKQSDLKQQLINGVIEEKKWTGWWTRARHAMKLDPMIDFVGRGGAHAEITRRSKPKTFEEEVQELFFAVDSDVADKISALKLLQDAAAKQAPSEELLLKMFKALDQEYKTGAKLSDVDKLQLAFAMEDLRELDNNLRAQPTSIPASSEMLEPFENSYVELAQIESTEYAARAINLLMDAHNEKGFELAAQLFPLAPTKLAQLIWKALDPENHKDMQVNAAQGILERPLENPQTFLWAIKQIGDGNWAHLGGYLPIENIVLELLDRINDWEKMQDHPSISKGQQATAKLLISRVKSQLENKGFAMLCSAVMAMDLDKARRLRRDLQQHQALPEAYRRAAERAVVLTRRELEDDQAVPTKTGDAPAAETGDALHYCTPLAREMKFRELNELNTVKIPENAREIEKARAEGDLKENAGYIYAKEMQKLLMQQTLQLQQALQTARNFDKTKVTTGSVGFGTYFEAENEATGNTENYTVLGRFETDPDRNIVSYQSPFMSQFMGTKLGETVDVTRPDGKKVKYTIKKITNALESGEWDAPEAE